MTQKLDWGDIRALLTKLPPGKPYGVPRGGAIVAGLTGLAVDNPLYADYIVDDIIDSGRTRDRWLADYPNKPFIALIDKSKPHSEIGWIQFPWECDGAKDIEDTVIRQLEFIGEDPTREGLQDTPRRVIKALSEMTEGYHEDPGIILSKVFTQDYDEMVVLKDIEFWSLCEHHLLPFHGRIGIGYIPNGKIVGISKLARLVKCYARRLQVQERMTQEIAQAIQDHLKPLGVGVIAQATHLCMAMRGVEEPANMVTSCLLGAFRDTARPEFLRLFDGKTH
jgi:GTP cyclohydrolase I